jgi:DNA-directed RNA polymerase specialized sigma24 family protein
VTAEQFTALAQLLRMQDGPSLTAARLVLVDGMRNAEAAALAGITPGGAHNAVTRMRRGLELATVAAGR